MGEARARSVKDGLARLAEASILDRYSLIGVASATSTNAVDTGAHQRGDPRGAVVVRPVE